MRLKDEAIFEDIMDEEYNVPFGSHDYFEGHAVDSLPRLAIRHDATPGLGGVGFAATRLSRRRVPATGV